MSDSFYTSKAWLDMRQTILLRDMWTCQVSGLLLREGRTSPDAAVIDHIIPRAINSSLELDPRNLWSITKQIHDTIMASIERRHRGAEKILQAKLNHKVVGVDGYPSTPQRSPEIGTMGLL